MFISSTLCTVAGCDSLHLGTLLQRMRRINLQPRPEKPFRGITYSSIEGMLDEMDRRANGSYLQASHYNAVCPSHQQFKQLMDLSDGNWRPDRLPDTN